MWLLFFQIQIQINFNFFYQIKNENKIYLKTNYLNKVVMCHARDRLLSVIIDGS